ncbi:MAG: serine/threonine protein kinase [Bacteroidales bacterium]|nr:serine/threonine protein kinase [Bacteroidales bacterium]
MAVKCTQCEQSLDTATLAPSQSEVVCPHCGEVLFTLVSTPQAAESVAGQVPAHTFKPAPITDSRQGSESGFRLTPHPQSFRVAGSPTSSRSNNPAPPSAVEMPSPAWESPQASAAGSCAGVASPGGSHSSATPTELPGYRIERCLGHGGMGAVFLARQLSLDRHVAVKVMSASWAVDPVFVARFTREAYAAALLNHQNVVQIYDIGETNGTRFFSMEYVPGRTLADLVRLNGKIEAETAVGYILQAARGLQHAHERGLIHRDVKPDNLLLTEQGVVKVADLGLVKTPDAAQVRIGRRPLDETDSGGGLASLAPNMTGHRIALGTPAYMAPEQCRDASVVDHRADIYSLGCTLYVLLTGQPPFEADTAVELMSKHAYEPLVPPEQISSRVPKTVSAIVQKMMEKDPETRYQNMGEVVRVLEEWLGVYHTGRFTPRDHDMERVERYTRIFQSAPTAVLRDRVVSASLSSCSVLAVLLMFFGRLDWAFGLAGMVLHACGLYFVLNGVARKTHLFSRVNQYLIGLSLWDWAGALMGVGLFTLLIWSLGLLWIWLGFGLIGYSLAIAMRYGFDRAIDEERYVPVAKCQRLAQRLRMGGVTEDDLRQFVAKHAGKSWEEFFEAVFGFEAKLTTRLMLLRAGNAGDREKFAAWREPLVALFDRVEKSRREEKDRQLLERVERARLIAGGMTEHTANDHAAAVADQFIDRTRAVGYRTQFPGGGAGRTSPSAVVEMVPSQPGRFARWRLFRTVDMGVRAGLALALMGGFLIWVVQNHPIDRMKALFDTSSGTGRERIVALFHHQTTPLTLDAIPVTWTHWCDTANVGVAGLILLITIPVSGFGSTLLFLLGAAIMVLGHHLGIRTVEPVRDYHVALLLGMALFLLGLRVGQRT